MFIYNARPTYLSWTHFSISLSHQQLIIQQPTFPLEIILICVHEFVVVQCGVDGLAGDPHAIWNWSLNDGEGSLGWCVGRICNQWGCKVLMLGGGEHVMIVRRLF